MKVVKWKLASFFSTMTDNTVPAKPFAAVELTHTLMCGGTGRWISHEMNRLEKFNKQTFYGFLSTILVGVKKGSPRPGKEDVSKALDKTFTTLTSAVEPPKEAHITQSRLLEPEDIYAELSSLFEIDRPIIKKPTHRRTTVARTWPVEEESKEVGVKSLTSEEELYYKSGHNPPTLTFSGFPGEEILTQEIAVREIYRTVTEVIGKQKFTENFGPYMPSTSANYISSRSGLGSIGALMDQYSDLLTDLRTPGGPIESDEGAILKTIDTAVVEGKLRTQINPIFRSEPIPNKFIQVFDEEGRGFDEPVYSKEDGTTVIDEGWKPDLRQEDLKARFKTLWNRARLRAHEEENLAEMVGLPEALKVRVITKSQPARSFTLQTLQKMIHRKMRQHPTFKLIGEPVTEDLINNFLGPIRGHWETYISGDYEAATDNFYTIYSEACGKAIADCLQLPHDLTELLLDSLCRFKIEHKGEVKQQTRGQLMGSVTSFPVLCLINAALSRYAYERAYNRYYLLKDIPMLINGDDIVIRGITDIYKIWSECTAFVGLKESIGKTFVSRLFLQINSTLFYLEENKLIEAKFVNFGLLKGLKRSGSGESFTNTSSTREMPHMRFRDLLRQGPIELREELADIFISKQAHILKAMGLPFHLPTWLGGAGIFYPGVKRCTPSDLDLRIAGGILWEKRPEDQPLDIGATVATWQIRRIAERRSREPLIVGETCQGVEEYEAYIAYKSVGLLFDSNVRLADLFDMDAEERQEKRVNYAIRKNKTIYNPRRWANRMPKAISMESLEKRQIFRSCKPPRVHNGTIEELLNQVDLFDRLRWQQTVEYVLIPTDKGIAWGDYEEYYGTDDIDVIHV